MNWSKAREQMVREQIARRGIRDARVLEAMFSVPRHLFVPPDLRERAYDDGPLPIGCNQTISQPYIVAAMSALLELRGDENVLEIGTGSGYQAAVLARLARQVHTVERYAALAKQAEQVFAGLNLTNIAVHIGDGSSGWAEGAPYQAIVLTAAAPTVAPSILEQLADGGRLVLPVGNSAGQDLQRWRREGDKFVHESFFPVSFVPLRGAEGWSEEDWERRSTWI